jgi:hypothetical protein
VKDYSVFIKRAVLPAIPLFLLLVPAGRRQAVTRAIAGKADSL